MANRFATYVICISEHELELLGSRPEKSVVVYNYIHESAFVPKNRNNITYDPNKSLIIISLGGLNSLKGGKKLLQALKETKANVRLLLVGTVDPRIDPGYLRTIDGEAYTNELIELLNDPMISGRVEMIGKVKDPATYIDKAHALIFWAERPHFPRTVFEAWIMHKPVVYYNHGFHNPVITSDRVLEVKDGSPSSLSDAITHLPGSEIFRPESIQQCYELAQANFSEKNFNKIDDIYRRCIQR